MRGCAQILFPISNEQTFRVMTKINGSFKFIDILIY
jgi:hypothetical protein